MTSTGRPASSASNCTEPGSPPPADSTPTPGPPPESPTPSTSAPTPLTTDSPTCSPPSTRSPRSPEPSAPAPPSTAPDPLPAGDRAAGEGDEEGGGDGLGGDDGDRECSDGLLVQGAGGDAADERAHSLHRREQPERGGPAVRPDEVGDQRLDRGVLQAHGRSPQQDAAGDRGEPAGEGQRRH